MRKAFLILLTLLLALPILTGTLAEVDGFAVITCPEEGFSTLADFDCTTEYQEGDGLYIMLSDQLMPYLLVSVDFSDTRVTDPDTYMTEKLAPHFQSQYKDNGALMSVVHGDGRLNGKNTPILEMQYHNSQGAQIWLVAAFDVQDAYTVYYRVRWYREEDRNAILAALETVAENLKPDPDYYTETAGPQPQGGGTESGGGTANTAGTAMSFAVTDVVQGGMVMGRCTAPADYQVFNQANCSVMTLGAGNPWLLLVAAQSPDGMTMLTYTSPRNYMASATGETPDEQFNSDYYTPMLHYMNAAEYCDYRALQLTDIKSIELVEENTYPELQAMLRQREASILQMHGSMLGGTGLTVDKVATTIASCRYRVETTTGLTCCFCVTAVTEGTWYTASLPGPYISISNSYILWDLPCVYTMLCPEALWEEGMAAFIAFSENTSVSDQFLAANQRLSNELWNIITGRGGTYGDEYSERVMREETAEGNDYDEDRFTDYLFDQNDYTLSDGSHVKVSTAYDYVYEGDNGTVYYSNSAFAEPGGSTRLTPNR